MRRRALQGFEQGLSITLPVPSSDKPVDSIFSFWGSNLRSDSVYVFLKMAHRFEFSCNYSNSGGPLLHRTVMVATWKVNHGNSQATESSFMSCWKRREPFKPASCNYGLENMPQCSVPLRVSPLIELPAGTFHFGPFGDLMGEIGDRDIVWIKRRSEIWLMKRYSHEFQSAIIDECQRKTP